MWVDGVAEAVNGQLSGVHRVEAVVAATVEGRGVLVNALVVGNLQKGQTNQDSPSAVQLWVLAVVLVTATVQGRRVLVNALVVGNLHSRHTHTCPANQLGNSRHCTS